MSLYSVIPSFTFDTTATASCLQQAHELNYLFEWLSILGVLLPVIIWPFLPSKSEVVNYRILAVTSVVHYVSLLLRVRYPKTPDTHGPLRSLFLDIWGLFDTPFMTTCGYIGYMGHGANQSGEKLVLFDFDVAASATFSGLFGNVVYLVHKLNGESNIYYNIAISLFFTVAYWHGHRLLGDMYYPFVMRRISCFYWLPQNGAEAEFNPWWSRSLRFIWAGYALVLFYVALGPIDFVRECRLQLEQ